MAGHRLIIDANIFLEALLKQERAEECALFLGKLSEGDHEVAIAAFSLFAVAIRLERAGKCNALVSFFSDCERAEYAIYQPSFANQQASIEVCFRTGLDFDDARNMLRLRNWMRYW